MSERYRTQDERTWYRYHLLRAALAGGEPGLAGLDRHRLAEIARKADKTFELESLVLGSPEALETQISNRRLEEAVSQIRGRYPDRVGFLADLAKNGLDEEVLRLALHRELIFDAVMQRVATRRPAVSAQDERLFFELHKERFKQPERRTARHILITVNEDFAENRRHAAWARIEQLAERLAGRASRFPSLARKHSECPSAMEGGRLGVVSRGQLYRSLDAVLFSLPEGTISRPVESELGFHLLWCEKIQQRRSLTFSKARKGIRQLLEDRSARSFQKAWIDELQRAAAVVTGQRKETA